MSIYTVGCLPANSQHSGWQNRHVIGRTELRVDGLDELLADEGADGGVGKRLAVVAVNGRLPARCPGVGLLRTKFDGFDLEEELGDLKGRIKLGRHATKVRGFHRGAALDHGR